MPEIRTRTGAYLTCYRSKMANRLRSWWSWPILSCQTPSNRSACLFICASKKIRHHLKPFKLHPFQNIRFVLCEYTNTNMTHGEARMRSPPVIRRLQKSSTKRTGVVLINGSLHSNRSTQTRYHTCDVWHWSGNADDSELKLQSADSE